MRNSTGFTRYKPPKEPKKAVILPLTAQQFNILRAWTDTLPNVDLTQESLCVRRRSGCVDVLVPERLREDLYKKVRYLKRDTISRCFIIERKSPGLRWIRKTIAQLEAFSAEYLLQITCSR